MLGLPGAGKGTQARLIAQKLEIPTVSSGDLFFTRTSETPSEIGLSSVITKVTQEV